MTLRRLIYWTTCLATLTAACILAPAGCRAPAPATPPRSTPRALAAPVRGVWVARFHYRTPEDVRSIIANCAALGCNTVYWQVRGEGTVCYPSPLEPWAREFDHRDPGFDPLELAIQAARHHGLRLEAWVNVLPGWRGEQPPPHPQQLWNAHPDWFLRDAAGQRQRLGDHYLILNPCLPEARAHIVAVIADLAARYDIDGLHLDYVRYAWDTEPDAQRKYPRDPRTLAIYRQQTGKHPDDDPTAWKHWRANQLTRLVAEIRTALHRQRPGAVLTAAVMRDPRTAYDRFFQNGVTWLRTGLVDALVPMAYTTSPADFATDISAYRSLSNGRRIIPGLGLYMHERPDALHAQLDRCADWGGDFALFSYASLYPTQEDRNRAGGPTPKDQAARQTRRQVLNQFARPAPAR
jgi:uncharacterized lipoprotein YddW (UPF0748 family)